MKKITEITPKQAARFSEWTERWIKIGLSTEPADFDCATAAALRAYKLVGLKRPMVILRMGSPYAAVLGGTIAWAMLREGKAQVRDQVGAQVWDQVGAQVWAQVGAQVGAQVWGQVRAQVRDGIGNDYGGAFGANWGAYVAYMRDVLGWNGSTLERFEIDEALIRSCGWVWWHENVLAISDRPAVINRDETGRLHCETGPSIAYRDGWSLYHWHGVAIPEHWIKDRANLNVADVFKEENAETRRAGCNILGWDRVLAGIDAKLIDEDGDPQIGALYEGQIPGAVKCGFLKVRCGTGREFVIPVAPEARTAIEAQAWIQGVSVKNWQRPEVRG